MSLCVSNFHPDYFEFALIWRVTAVGCLMSSKWGGRKKTFELRNENANGTVTEEDENRNYNY